MGHKLDVFFRKKLELVDDDLPEDSGFDEGLLWEELQKNLHKPQTNRRWKWFAVASCLAGMMLCVFFASKPDTDIVEDTIAAQPSKLLIKSEPMVETTTPTLKKPKHTQVKKEMPEPLKETKPTIEALAIKSSEPVIPVHIPYVKQDSIHFRVPVMAETKAKFKVIHVNEISKTENEEIPQPKFKIRFAARNLH